MTSGFDAPTSRNSTGRFSDRVADYVRARPSYPPQIVDVLCERCGLRDGAIIADIGAGTGLLAQVLLARGFEVIGVEPNDEMRRAGETMLDKFSRYRSIAGSAEATTLDARSVDMITAAQAFHWFDRPRTRTEFDRVLRPGGHVVLIWNDRQIDSTPFLRGYESLLVTHCPEYLKVVHRNVDEQALREFYAPQSFDQVVLGNRQDFDWDTLVARHLSSSFVPKSGEGFERGMAALRTLHDQYHVNGMVTFEYDTRVYFGKLS